MKKSYTFVVHATVSLVTDVKAETLAEAMEIAKGRSVMGLCHQCNGGDSRREWGTELDCEVDLDTGLEDLFVDNECVDLTDEVQTQWKGHDQ